MMRTPYCASLPLGVATLGWRCTAPDAMLALIKIHKDPPDIVLLDIKMPAGNGVNVLEMLTSDPRLADIPVIIFTGQSDEKMANRCKRPRAYYVKKSPDAWVELKPIIQGLLRLRRSERAASE